MIPGIVSAPLFASVVAMNAVASPSSVSKVKAASSPGSALLTTPTTTVTVTGGTAPYSHSWTTDGAAAATASTSATTAFSETILKGDADSSLFTDTVTDANGVVATADCTAVFQYVDTGG